MALPTLNDEGELPIGIHAASMDEVIATFGSGTAQREAVTARLIRIRERAQGTGKLLRFVIFGSYITAKAEPNDVDVVLVMSDEFDLDAYDEETRSLFYHLQAGERWGASIFWTCPGSLLRETVDQFLAYWQTKRDQDLRGIVEVTS